LNAYLASKGEAMVNLDQFRNLPGSSATGADPTKKNKRLTNLVNLNVDTSWYTRYRSSLNPDSPFNETFPQAVTIKGQPAIPVNDTDTPPGSSSTPPAVLQPVPPTTVPQRRMQAIANTAGFHFAFIEQGGSSLYTTMAQKVTSLEVLRIVVSIGGVEVDHFSLWHDKAGNAVSQPLAGVIDPENKNGLMFPDLNAVPPQQLESVQTNLILPEPCEFLRKGLPECSVIRPTSTEKGGAVAAFQSWVDDLLFMGQPPHFFDTVMALAVAADAAHRELQS
jgi:hypothetical protein